MLCDYNCGQEAKFQLKCGKWCCSNSSNKCPEIRIKNSLGNKGRKYNWKNGHPLGMLGKIPWHKGLTKETDSRMKNRSENIKQKYKNGILKPVFKNQHHTEETKKILSLKAQARPHKEGMNYGAGKHGWYKGYWCDSSWELAYTIFNIEHDIQFERNKKKFPYTFNGKIHNYIPDYKLSSGEFIEIKGWINEEWKIKIKDFPEKLIIITENEIKPYLKYVTDKYGSNFINLYENKTE